MSFKYPVLNAEDGQYVVCIDRTDEIGCGRLQYVYQL
jgi:hypothetical protein